MKLIINPCNETVTVDGKVWSKRDFLQYCFEMGYEGTLYKVETAFLNADKVIWEIFTKDANCKNIY